VRFCVFLENDKTDLCQIFFQGFRENAYSLQPALKSNAHGLQNKKFYDILVVFQSKDKSSEYILTARGLEVTAFASYSVDQGSVPCPESDQQTLNW